MRNKQINLLPVSRQRLNVRSYYLRFGVVAIALATALLIVATVLLIPTYVFLTGSASTKTTQLAHIQSTLSSSKEVALSARLKALSNEAKTLAGLADKPSASKIFSSVLHISRPGIIILGFTYTPVTGRGKDILVLSGKATTRNALRNYQLSLQSAPFATSVDLPVSAYAKDTNIPFLITMKLTI